MFILFLFGGGGGGGEAKCLLIYLLSWDCCFMWASVVCFLELASSCCLINWSIFLCVSAYPRSKVLFALLISVTSLVTEYLVLLRWN